MKKSILLFISVLGLFIIGCEDNEPLPEKEDQLDHWKFIENLRTDTVFKEPFKLCAVNDDELLLLSFNKFLRADLNENIIEERIIPLGNEYSACYGVFLSKGFYIVANYSLISNDYDSLQFDFYSTEPGYQTIGTFKTNVLPEQDKYIYWLGFNNTSHLHKSIALNSENELAFLITGSNRNENILENHHYAIIVNMSNAEGRLNLTTPRIIELDFPNPYVLEYEFKAIGEDFYLVTNDYGTYTIKPSGKIDTQESNKNIFEYNDTTYQFGIGKIEYSIDGINWNTYKYILDDDDDLYDIAIIDNYLYDFGIDRHLFNYSLTDFKLRKRVNDGLPTNGVYFFEEFNDKVYIGNHYGEIYSINKEVLLKRFEEQ